MDLTAFKLITFDCYGTLIDWESGISACLEPIFASRGVAFDREEALNLYAEFERTAEGGDGLDSGAEFGETREHRPYREVLAEVMDCFAERYGFALSALEQDALADSIERWPAFPDTSEALRRLKRRCKLAVLSNIDNDLFVLSKPKLGVDLDFVVTAELCRSYKPAPKHWRVVQALSGLSRDEILHVAESRYHDIVPAKALGFSTVWINRRGQGGGASTGHVDLDVVDSTPDLELRTLSGLADRVEAAYARKRW